MDAAVDRGLEAVSRLIRLARAESGLSQGALATEAGCATKTIHNLELGGRRPLDRVLRGLERALGFDLGTLDHVLASDAPEDITLEDLRPSADEDHTIVSSLSEVPDIVLFTEIMSRLARTQTDLAAALRERDDLRAQLDAPGAGPS